MYDRNYYNFNFIRIGAEKSNILEGYSAFKFNNLELALGMALTFDTSLAKALILKVRNFGGLISTFVEATREKLIVGVLLAPSLSILTRVNTKH